jgi:hypothetical protein
VRTSEGPGSGGTGRDRLRQQPDPQPEEGYGDEYDDDGYDGEYDEELSPAEAARAAGRHIAQLTGKELCGVVFLERSDDVWRVGVEVVEDRRVPSSSDILGLYEIEVDLDGELVTYRRSRRYARGRGDSSEVI